MLNQGEINLENKIMVPMIKSLLQEIILLCFSMQMVIHKSLMLTKSVTVDYGKDGWELLEMHRYC